jgi:DNA anti-recombination protein RmuC
MTVPVPETHVRAALEAIQNTLDTCQKESATCSESQNTRVNQLCTQIFQQIQNVLTDQISNAVQPIPLEEYMSKYVPFPTPVRRKLLNHDDNDEMSDDDDDEDMIVEPTEENNESFPEEELEEEDLLDQEALTQAQALREKVRQAASRNRALAEGYLQRITTLMKAEEEASSQLLFPPTQSTSTMVDPSVLEGFHDKVVSLGKNLTQLQDNLNELQNHVPDQREALQSTIETVDYYLEKQRHKSDPVSSTDSTTVHGIEDSITSRDNEGVPRWKSVAKENKIPSPGKIAIERPPWKDKSAELRLATFLSNYP